MASLLKELPSMSALLSAYASISALSMLIRTILNEMIPKGLRDWITLQFSHLFSSYFLSDFTYVIKDRWHGVENETFRAVKVYLPTKIGPSTTSLLLGTNDTNNITAPPQPGIPIDTKVIDHFQNMRFEWTLCQSESTKYSYRQKFFLLKCKKGDREEVINSYLPHISRSAELILSYRENLNISSYDCEDSSWESSVFKHPATFDTLAMDPDLKKFIIEDLDMFVKRKDYFLKVGRAWKRGYLLYGPPGTGKSTLVAAIANHLRFDIYDLQLQGVRSDSQLRRILTSTTNRSILLIEDIDCSSKSTRARAPVNSSDDKEKDSDDEDGEVDKKILFDPGVTLSGLLNFIDGLWSSCGDERIIIFTTNYKEKLDPALLRPGRMDVHVYMGYCTSPVFRTLAYTYLGVKDHVLMKSVEDIMQKVSITPAEVGQHLMKSDKPQIALECLLDFLRMKEIGEGDKKSNVDGEEVVKEEVIGKCDRIEWKKGSHERISIDLVYRKILSRSTSIVSRQQDCSSANL